MTGRSLGCAVLAVLALLTTAPSAPAATAPGAAPGAGPAESLTAAAAVGSVTSAPTAAAAGPTPAGPTAAAAGPTAAASGPGGGQRLVVTFTEGTSAAQRAAVLARTDGAAPERDADVRAQSLDGAALAVVHATAQRRRALERDPRVRSVHPDLPIRAGTVSVTDPEWPGQDGVRRLRVPEVWEESTGDADVVIAVVDTGVDPDNRDLRGRVVSGYDFVNLDRDPHDDNGHGTAVATIAAAAGDQFGIAGVCWRCRVMPVKVLDDEGNGFLSDAALGIAWAVEHGADIINVSLGAGGTMPALDDALAAAQRAGVLVVASAGNSGGTGERWPAADPRVVGVAALGRSDGRASYSDHGPWVDVAAPGCNPSGWLDDDVIRFCGTSSATPLVSGVAGLLMSARHVPAAKVRSAVHATAVPVGVGLGAGRVDAFAALQRLPAFADIAGNVHAANITVLAAEGITSGCTAGLYCPRQAVTRGQFATFLDRALGLPDGSGTFADVPEGHPHAAGIGAVTSAGIALGCAPARYCPADALTRGQMASLLQRALGLPDGPSRFADAPDDYAHARGVRAIAAAGITGGCAAERFCPARPVTRAQMASFLVRALDL